MNSVELRDAFELSDRLLKRREDLGIAVVVIEIDDRLRQQRNQIAQYLTLHGSEIEEAVDDQQLNVRQPRHAHKFVVDHAAQHPKRAQLLGVFFSKQVLIQKLGVIGV